MFNWTFKENLHEPFHGLPQGYWQRTEIQAASQSCAVSSVLTAVTTPFPVLIKPAENADNVFLFLFGSYE